MDSIYDQPHIPAVGSGLQQCGDKRQIAGDGHLWIGRFAFHKPDGLADEFARGGVVRQV
jgi:hypothetical protein